MQEDHEELLSKAVDQNKWNSKLIQTSWPKLPAKGFCPEKRCSYDSFFQNLILVFSFSRDDAPEI